MATLLVRKRALGSVCLAVTVLLISYFTLFRETLPHVDFTLARNPLEQTQSSTSVKLQPSVHPLKSKLSIDAVSNATLGFEKIIAINLPERTDRRDVLTLMTTMSGIDLDWQDGVKGEDMGKATWPTHWNTGENKNLKLGELGNWRSHVSALRRVVEGSYASALILEDDADWDVSLKSQLRAFAEKTRIIGKVSLSANTPSPYGDQWDILWLGNCATPPAPQDSQQFEIPVDKEFRVFPAHGGMSCLYGYAVTRWAAEMLMGWLLDVKEPTDFAISVFCTHYKCITVTPELIGSHKSAGITLRDSNISNRTGNYREEGETRNIVNSAVMDMLSRMGHERFSEDEGSE